MTKFIRNSNVVELSCKIKTYEFAEEATYVGINEAMEVYIQLYFKKKFILSSNFRILYEYVHNAMEVYIQLYFKRYKEKLVMGV